MKAVFTTTAVRHIENQISYLVDRGAPRAALAARIRLTAFVTEFLVRYPRTGRFIAEKDVYEIWVPRTRYVIFYRLERDNTLTVLAVFHTSQDRSAFEAEDENRLESPMTAPPASPELGSIGRRIAVFAVIGVLLFAVLWYTIFSAVTAALIAAGGTGALVVGSTVSDTFESIFEMLANIILGILAAIAAIFAAIFSAFD